MRKLGAGGMGAVYKGVQRSLRRTVAIKVLPPEIEEGDMMYAERFKREAQSMARLTHPNIASVLDGGTAPDGRPYFVMELVRGLPITEFCDHKRLSVRERLELFIQVCQAIQHAHQKGVIHRDIKPQNILVGRDNIVKLNSEIAKALAANAIAAVSATPQPVAPPAKLIQTGDPASLAIWPACCSVRKAP